MADGDHARLQRGTPNNTIIIIIYLQSGASLVLRSCFGWMLAMFNKKSRQRKKKTRSSWLNCALRDDEAVYWVSIGHYEAVAVGN